MYGTNTSEVSLFPGDENLPGRMQQEIKRGHRPGTYRIGDVRVYFMVEQDHRTLDAMRKLRDMIDEDILTIVASKPPSEEEYA